MNSDTIKTQILGHGLIGIGLAGLAIRIHNPLAYAGALGYGALLFDSFLRQSELSARTANFRIGVALFLFPILILPLASQMQNAIRPRTIDGLLRAADLRLHLDGFVLSRFCLEHDVARWAVIAVYSGLPLVLALAWMASRSEGLVRAAVIAALLAQPCYLLFPATGPQYAFAGWPFHHAQLLPVISSLYARNCVPSLHFTWAALTAIYTCGRWRWPFIAYAGLMALATVAGGEHYAVDVVASIPFIWLVQRLAVRQKHSVQP
jgi:hypothetical protein